MTKKVCSACNGAGFLKVEKDGKSYRTRCKCAMGAIASVPLFQIPERYRECSFDSFKLKKTDHHSLAVARTKTRDFAQMFPLVMKGLLIIGGTGCGKTHLASSIFNTLHSKNIHNVVFINYMELLKKIKSTYDPQSGVSENELLHPILNAALLIIDDIGAERDTQWSEDQFSQILNHRYNHKLPVVITTNLSDDNDTGFDSLEDRIGKRMRSRLYEMCEEIKILGDDYRKIKAHKH